MLDLGVKYETGPPWREDHPVSRWLIPTKDRENYWEYQGVWQPTEKRVSDGLLQLEDDPSSGIEQVADVAWSSVRAGLHGCTRAS